MSTNTTTVNSLYSIDTFDIPAARIGKIDHPTLVGIAKALGVSEQRIRQAAVRTGKVTTKPVPCVTPTHFEALLQDLAQRRPAVEKAQEILDVLAGEEEEEREEVEENYDSTAALEEEAALVDCVLDPAAPSSTLIDKLSQQEIEDAMKASNYNYLQHIYYHLANNNYSREDSPVTQPFLDLVTYYHKVRGYYPRLNRPLA